VQQHLELEALASRVVHIEHCLQSVFAKRHAVHQPELIRPRLSRISGEVLVREAEVDLDAVIAAFR
jgi:hypothetical protein